MPWKEQRIVDVRLEFVMDVLRGEQSKSALCRHYGISRPTGDKWLARFRAEGEPGLADHSSAPRHRANETPEWIRIRLVETKKAKQTMGPKKIVAYLKRREPDVAWPSQSTAGQILKRAGLVQPRRLRRRVPPDTQPFANCKACNQVWSADFKGDFLLGNRKRCYPLTITDNCSRYIFACQGLYQPSKKAVWPWFEWVFRTYGLPEAIRTDNGSPFASLAIGGLSYLSKWWIQLGIKPERIEVGKPAQNGRHERMHLSLKQAVLNPPEASLERQQESFNTFIHEYNEERPHEALGMLVPHDIHTPALRSYPVKLRPIEYDAGFTVRTVRHNGQIKWRGTFIYLSEVLAKERVGLKQVEDGKWALYYSFHLLGTLNERTKKIESASKWHGK